MFFGEKNIQLSLKRIFQVQCRRTEIDYLHAIPCQNICKSKHSPTELKLIKTFLKKLPTEFIVYRVCEFKIMLRFSVIHRSSKTIALAFLAQWMLFWLNDKNNGVRNICNDCFPHLCKNHLGFMKLRIQRQCFAQSVLTQKLIECMQYGIKNMFTERVILI